MRLCLGILMGVLVGLVSNGAHADEFPSRPITLINSLGGGGSDAVFRKISQRAEKELGQPIVVIGKAGAGGTLGAVQMAQTAKADGYTVAAAFGGLLRRPLLYKVDWDPMRDFTWIIGLGGYTFGVAVKSDSPFKTLQEVVAWAKANPGKLSYGTPGVGSTTHILMADLAYRAGIEPLHVPFTGGAQVTTAMLGGQTMVTINALGSFKGQIESGQARLLAIFDEQRNPKLPNVPTVKELGYDVVNSAPYGLVGPRNMPPEVVQRLHDAFKIAVEDPSTKEFLNSLYDKVIYRSTEDYVRWARTTYESERLLLRQAGLEVQ